MLIKKYCLNENKTINFALKKININIHKTLFVLNNKNEYLGSLSEGDIRRGILKFNNLKVKIKKLFNKNSVYLKKKVKDNHINNLFNKHDVDMIPLIEKKKIIYIYFKDQFKTKKNNKFKKLDVVIMAGGFAKRLKPLSDIFPKPLMPFKNQSLLRSIISNFKIYGSSKYFIMTHHKSNEIKEYIKSLNDNSQIQIVREKTPMGTIGGLGNLKKKELSNDFWVINCDTILDINLDEVYKFHTRKKALLTIVASKKNVNFPYGNCLVDQNSKLSNIVEKPNFKLLVNTGCYIFNKKILNIFSRRKNVMSFDNLVESILLKKLPIFVYKIDDSDWQDFGNLSSFKLN